MRRKLRALTAGCVEEDDKEDDKPGVAWPGVISAGGGTAGFGELPPFAGLLLVLPVVSLPGPVLVCSTLSSSAVRMARWALPERPTLASKTNASSSALSMAARCCAESSRFPWTLLPVESPIGWIPFQVMTPLSQKRAREVRFPGAWQVPGGIG